MAINTENNGGKVLKLGSRNRGVDISERKLVCPYCGKKGLTFRKLRKSHEGGGKSHQLIGIQCLADECIYMCRSGVFCFSRHVKAYHGNDKGTPYVAVVMDIYEDDVEDKHTGHCMFLSRVHALKKKEEKNQFKLAKLLYQDMKDKHAKKVEAAKIERKFKFEVKLVKKAMARNEILNKTENFVQDWSTRTYRVNKNGIFVRDRPKMVKVLSTKLLP